MCGICGIASADGHADVEALRAMSAQLVHRGPDSGGEHVDREIALGARRLSIIDLAGGDQPIANEDGSVVVVQNGEIYNYPELREELARAGHVFHTRSDTEVHVHLYEQHGIDFAERLRGMFAVAIWDASRRRLVLARDRYGIKPLYYRHVGGELRFASELRALPRGEIDTDGLEAFLAFNSIPAPYSIFRDVRKLPAGHVLVWENGSVTIERFARPGPTEVRDGDEAELVEELRARLRNSVKAHLLADVPVGVMLSGGVDSAALAALAAQETVEPVHTFTIGFAEKSFDERDDARLVAERYGTNHHELLVRPDPQLLLEALADAFDEPFADSSALPTYLISQLAADHVKVALSGEGGDELFGGYYTYAADLLADRAAPIARIARPLVEALPSSSRKASLDYRAKRFVRAAHLPPLERHHGWKEIFSPEARRELRGGGANGFDPVDVYRARYAETAGAPELARLQDVDFGVYLVDDLLVKTDRASMAHSLEVRVPFLDPVVTNLAFALPTRLKVRGLQKKVLLRKAVEPLVPREIVHGKKRGFSIPAAAWLRGELEPFARATLSAETLRRQGFFQPEPVARLVDEHVAGREDWSRQLWGLLAFTLWYERQVEQEPPLLRSARMEALAA
jgi:asparagine synthase (glutamine-hydrolysing)